MQEVLHFLTSEFERGSSYHTLNSHRSALKPLYKFENEDIISRFLRGDFRLIPVFPRYALTWDPKVVLNYVAAFFSFRILVPAKINSEVGNIISSCLRSENADLVKNSRYNNFRRSY